MYLIVNYLTPSDLADFGVTLLIVLFVLYFLYRFVNIQLTVLEKKAQMSLLDTYHIVDGEITDSENDKTYKVSVLMKSTKSKPDRL